MYDHGVYGRTLIEELANEVFYGSNKHSLSVHGSRFGLEGV